MGSTMGRHQRALVRRLILGCACVSLMMNVSDMTGNLMMSKAVNNCDLSTPIIHAARIMANPSNFLSV